MEKDFDSWNSLKKEINDNQRALLFKERDVWWCSIGLNVGHEENGKSKFFTRPVLVIRKFNSNIFLGVPLTSQVKKNKYYYKLSINGKSGCAMLSQLKIISSRRLRKRMEELPVRQFNQIRQKLSDIILGKNLSAPD